MKLIEFIQNNNQSIIDSWVDFAGHIEPWSESQSQKELQDHAQELLAAVVEDMKSPQSKLQQSEKSKGKGSTGKLSEVGRNHASGRLESGLNPCPGRIGISSVTRKYPQQMGKRTRGRIGGGDPLQ